MPLTMALGHGGPQDWAIIAVVALLVFGPKRLPVLGQSFGEAMRRANTKGDASLALFQAVLLTIVGLGLAFFWWLAWSR